MIYELTTSLGGTELLTCTFVVLRLKNDKRLESMYVIETRI